MFKNLFCFGTIVTVSLMSQIVFAQQSCESLKDLKLSRTSITSAAMVPAGPFSATDAGPGGAANTPTITVPAHCEVKGVIRPSRDSEIKFAVWLPATGWNGKYVQEGNGGWAGSIPYRSMIDPLSRGYATAATDDGHEGGLGAAWAIGHPEKLIDFGYRAVHETSVQAKVIIRALYGRDPSLSYFAGCSDGGREALMEAQRYPEDFNGILAGAPANNWSHLFTGFVWNEHALLNSPGSNIPPAKLPTIQKTVLAGCDSQDGLKDGLLENPRTCLFDPAVLLCKGNESSDCLTPPQVEALKKVYTGPKNSRTGEQIFPGYPPGAEAVPGTWATWITPANAANAIQFNFGNTYYGQAVFEDPKWDFRRLNFDTDVRFGDDKVGSVLNSTSPDLRSFRAEGGKLIQYHGWADAAISAINSIEYYNSVQAFLSKFPDPRSAAAGSVSDFYRLFMVPGMGHCGGGAGPNSFDAFSALETWVERGVAPAQMVGTGPIPGDPSKKMTRPLCLYPSVARYKGTGDPNDAANFSCAEAPNRQ
jgi:feruloyl esterase